MTGALSVALLIRLLDGSVMSSDQILGRWDVEKKQFLPAVGGLMRELAAAGSTVQHSDLRATDTSIWQRDCMENVSD